MIRTIKKILIFALFGILSCAAPPKFITFQGSTLDPAIKTFSVDNFYVESVEANFPPNLGNLFTENFKLYVQQNSRLQLARQPADLEFSGSIVRYDLMPIAAGGTENQNALLQRLTITVKVNFVNNLNDTESFEKNFSFYSDFGSEEKSG